MFALDVSRLAKKNPSGVEVVAREVCTRFLRENDEIIAVSPCEIPNIKNLRVTKWKRPWSLVVLPWFLWRNREINQILIVANTIPFLAPWRVRIFSFLHDLAFLDLGASKNYGFFEIFWQRFSAWVAAVRCEKIFVPSEFVAGRFREKYAKYAEKVRVVSLGVDLPKMGVKKRDDFVFCVGRLEKKKNVDKMLRGVARMGENVKVKIAGVGAERENLEKLAKSLKIGVEWLGFVSDVEKFDFMSRAGVFVFLGEGEGFGLPVLEAFVCGTPVVAADAGSLPEVCGGLAELVDPCDEKSVAEAISRVRKAENDEKVLKVWAKKFSWGETVKMVKKELTRNDV